MKMKLVLIVAAMVVPATAQAGSQSSNTSSNSSSNNGVVRERVVDSYCDDGGCERVVERRVYRDDRQGWKRDRRDWRSRYRDGHRWRNDDDD